MDQIGKTQPMPYNQPACLQKENIILLGPPQNLGRVITKMVESSPARAFEKVRKELADKMQSQRVQHIRGLENLGQVALKANPSLSQADLDTVIQPIDKRCNRGNRRPKEL